MEPFVRALVEGCRIKPAPPDSYNKLRQQLSAIGNNLNQLTHIANATGRISASQLDRAQSLLEDMWHCVRVGKGSRGSSSDSLQTAGRELCMPDEIRRMRDDECLLLMRSEDPVIDKKYNLLHHPNVKYTPDAGGEPYVMPPDYMGDAVTITMDAVAAATAPEITEEMYEQLDYLEKHPEENYYENEENFSQYDQGD